MWLMAKMEDILPMYFLLCAKQCVCFVGLSFQFSHEHIFSSSETDLCICLTDIMGFCFHMDVDSYYSFLSPFFFVLL